MYFLVILLYINYTIILSIFPVCSKLLYCETCLLSLPVLAALLVAVDLLVNPRRASCLICA